MIPFWDSAFICEKACESSTSLWTSSSWLPNYMYSSSVLMKLSYICYWVPYDIIIESLDIKSFKKIVLYLASWWNFLLWVAVVIDFIAPLIKCRCLKKFMMSISSFNLSLPTAKTRSYGFLLQHPDLILHGKSSNKAWNSWRQELIFLVCSFRRFLKA